MKDELFIKTKITPKIKNKAKINSAKQNTGKHDDTGQTRRQIENIFSFQTNRKHFQFLDKSKTFSVSRQIENIFSFQTNRKHFQFPDKSKTFSVSRRFIKNTSGKIYFLFWKVLFLKS